MRNFLLSLTLTSFYIAGLAQTSPCKTSENHKMLDFWVGKWEVKSPTGQLAGHNTITKILDDCTVFEEWTGAGQSRGKSMNFFNPMTGKWMQVWTDNFGNPLILQGDASKDKMVYTGVSLAADGSIVTNEMTLSKVSDNEVRQLWKQSNDEGKNWTIVFDGQYIRQE